MFLFISWNVTVNGATVKGALEGVYVWKTCFLAIVLSMRMTFTLLANSDMEN